MIANELLELMNSPQVSVIIPAHNRADSIRTAIDSALRQSVPPLEVLVVDDGSIDSTVAAVAAHSDPRVRCIELAVNRGAQFARLTGIKEARGEYLVFLDSDDELLPDSIELRLRALRDSGWAAALVYGDITRDGKVFPFERLAGNVYPYLLKELSLCPYSAMLIPKSCFATAGLPDDDFPSWQDDDMVLTIGRHFPVLHCDAPVAQMTGSGISHNMGAVLEGCRRMVEKYGVEILATHGRFRLACWRLRILRHVVRAKWFETRGRLRRGVRPRDLLLIVVFTVLRLLLKAALKPLFRHIYV